MRITTVSWVFIEIHVAPVRRTMNSVIGRSTSGADASNDARMHKKCECTRGHFAPEDKSENAIEVPFYLPSKNPSHPPPSRRTSALIPRGSTCPDSHTIRYAQCLLPRESPFSATRPLSCLEHNGNRFDIRGNSLSRTKIIRDEISFKSLT